MHEGDRHADRERVRRLVAEATFDSRDERVLPRFGLDDLAVETLRDYRNAFRGRHPDHPWANEPDEAFLAHLGALGRDRDSGEQGLTLAGLLMFGRYETIRDALPTYFVDYQERREGTGAIEWDDRVYPDGTWSGNVYDFFRRIVLKLKADLKVPFRLDNALLRVDETHVHEAVREALVNTLIHADYEGRISILVLKRPKGFEFRNPGDVRVSTLQLHRGGVSDCRNRLLQRMFLLLGIGEQVGSGFSRIERAWAEGGWPVPRVVEDVDVDTTTLVLELDKAKGQASFDTRSHTSSYASSDVSSATTSAVLLACRDEFLSVSEIVRHTGLAAVTVRKHLRKLLVAEHMAMKFPDRPNHPAQAYRAAQPMDKKGSR